ncbi:DUF6139 family protein [Ramlibacter tataouinensis]|uniref:Uncharacterized protein n=1 Tax=Ramlibacter tataouinensis (strain ATCC BAA-407 / DSM 14655 / LMG 21543 / TTB310) TaxID=365046 RepID=F5XYJ3_RAMTT|nr:DUF6139 family protein [Ramlibacter tataouinensis]AEG93169.1 hypothetical protein Rta_20760 [Ramlibacter tataouinensis TTB310]
MQLDIYRRPEPEHKLSYLAVPSDQAIPEEATNTDWVLHARAVELDENAPSFAEYGIDRAAQQMAEKGYAITSLAHQIEAGD